MLQWVLQLLLGASVWRVKCLLVVSLMLFEHIWEQKDTICMVHLNSLLDALGSLLHRKSSEGQIL